MPGLPYLLFAVACLFYTGLAYSIPSDAQTLLQDPDSGWHVAAGDLIRASGVLPAHDPWSFTAGDQFWYNIAWGWDVAASLVHGQLGWYGQIALLAIVTALTWAVVFYHAYLRSGHAPASFMAAGFALLASIVLLRPLAASNVLAAAALLLFFWVYRRGASGRWLWLLPPAVALWVNVHGGFLLLALVGAAHAAEDVSVRRFDRLRRLCLIGAICLAAALLNPYGAYIVEAVWRTLGAASRVFIDEWQPLGLKPSHATYWLYIAFFAALALRRGRLKNLPPAEKWLIAASLLMTLMAIRNFTFFAIVSVPVAATWLGEFISASVRAPNAAGRRFDALCLRLNRPCVAALAGALSLAASFMLFHPKIAERYAIYGEEPYADMRPAVEWIKAHYPRGRFLTSYSLGGPIIYLTRGQLPVFVDGRAETAYPPQLVLDYAAFETLAPGWEAVMDTYKLRGLVLYRGERHERYLRGAPGWRRAFEKNSVSIWLYTHAH